MTWNLLRPLLFPFYFPILNVTLTGPKVNLPRSDFSLKPWIFFLKKLIKSTQEKKIAVRTKHLPLRASAREHLGGYHKIHNQYYQIRFVQWWWFRADDCVKRTMEQLHLPSSVVGLLAAKLHYSSERILIAIR